MIESTKSVTGKTVWWANTETKERSGPWQTRTAARLADRGQYIEAHKADKIIKPMHTTKRPPR